MSKYRNVRTNGFDSKKEAKRAHELNTLQSAGEITDLQYQVRYLLVPKQNGERAVHYVADFVYRDKEGHTVVEDAKGMKTPLYILKRKLMLHVHGIKIREI